MELVVGATGYVGGLLAERLQREGRAVRALARDPDRLRGRASFEVVKADLLRGPGLARALDGCTTAYYLVHSLEPTGGTGDFGSRDRRAAERFVRAARTAGIERVVYLGGLLPAGGAKLSAHLASRLEVERVLLEGIPGSTALRSSILIGAGSSSFQILVRLVERLRFVPLPAWRRKRTKPIDERDAIEYLARTPMRPAAAGRSLDIAGPDVLSYADMIDGIAEMMGVGRAPVRLPVSQTPAASAVVSALTDQPLELVRPLMESLEQDLLPRTEEAGAIYGIRPRPFDRAVEHALSRWERERPLAAR